MSDQSRILIVEDDLDLAEMLHTFFRVQGYDVQTAAWGEDAIRLSQETPPHLVMLDIRLPDIDGYEICRRLRGHRRTQDVPVIFLTEKRDRLDRLAGLELGVVDYITKPFDIQELRLRVRNTLRRAAQPAQVNTVTTLPEGAAVSERLDALLESDARWAVLLLAVEGMDDFREHYGFVAADDVLRALALMMNNAVREAGADEAVVGHLSAHEFVALTDVAHVDALHERLAARLQQSMAFFYPLNDFSVSGPALDVSPDVPPEAAPPEGRLRMFLGRVTHAEGPFADRDALREAIRASRRRATPQP